VKFSSLVSSLTRPVTGYLRQQPQFANALPASVEQSPWLEMCTATHRMCADWKKSAREISRDPVAPIQGLLNLAEPFAPILRAVRTLDAAAVAALSGSQAEAIAKRDALLLSMLIANPLRNRNYVLMTWHEDNSGVLYQRQDGQWRVRFGGNDFKNDGFSSNQTYDAQLPQALTDRISEYVHEYRPRLTRNSPNSAWAFPSNSGTMWKGLSRHVAQVTKRLVIETPGFGTHAFRHLVASDYLRKHPNDYLTVAVLLNDKLETVLSAYAHLRQDESFVKYERHIQDIAF